MDSKHPLKNPFFPNLSKFRPHIRTFSTPTPQVLRSLPLQRLKRNTLFVDVLSVKEFPKKLMLKILPPYFDILCLHPMFGPDSGRGSWSNLPLVYDRVRVNPEKRRTDRCNAFLAFWENEGCRSVVAL